MNARELQSNVAPRDSAEDGRLAVLEQFRVEDIQHLGRDDLLAAQNLAGHGSEWGRWQTPKSIVPGLKKSYRDINLAGRLRDYLAKEEPTAASVDHLMDQGVLLLTRLALIARLIATGGNGHGKTTRLKPSTIVQQLFQYWPRIVARAIRRKADDPSAAGLLRCLIEADLLEFNGYKPTRIEVNRLDTLVARGVWSDAPPTADIRQMTNPAARPAARPPQAAPEPYPPLPDDWLAEIGPRVLWIVQIPLTPMR